MKKSLMFLLILTATMIFVIPAKSYADPQLDTLLNIATQARDNLSITISQINNTPVEINQLYNQGSNETDALAQAVSQQDVDSAKQHFLAAMRYFKQTNDAINSLNATTTSNDQQKAEINQLQGEIIRLENMGNLLKSIALQNNVDVNFTSFYQTLQTANQDINAGNLDDASKQIQTANEFIVATHNSITEAAQEQISQRAKEFTEKQIAQLNNVTQSNVVQQNNTGEANNTISSTTPPQYVVPHSTLPNNLPPTTSIPSGSNVTVPNNPKDMVAELKTLVSQGKVDQAINLIKIIQSYQREKLAEKTLEMNPQIPHEIPPANATLPTLPPHEIPPANATLPTLPPHEIPPANATLPTLPPHEITNQTNVHGPKENEHGKVHNNTNSERKRGHHED